MSERGERTRPDADIGIQFWIYLGTAVFLLGTAVVYWFLSYEVAGTVMLALGGGLGLIVAAWLGLRWRRPAHAAGTAAEFEEEWGPHASGWPFWIGLGGATAAAGLALTPWLVIPGGMVLLLGLVGWIGQSRRRD
jgi:Cytochrome c oxidase subunit IV